MITLSGENLTLERVKKECQNGKRRVFIEEHEGREYDAILYMQDNAVFINTGAKKSFLLFLTGIKLIDFL